MSERPPACSLVGPILLRERLVLLDTLRMDFRDLVRRGLRALPRQPVQRLLRLLRMPERVLGHRNSHQPEVFLIDFSELVERPLKTPDLRSPPNEFTNMWRRSVEPAVYVCG
jgi:hypothetical protein